MKKIIAINAGPRTGWNTDQLIKAAGKGAEEIYDAIGYNTLLANYQQTLSRFVGPAQVLSCGNTLQVKDYSKYNWTLFDPEAKKAHHDETFGDYLEKAHTIGKTLLNA